MEQPSKETPPTLLPSENLDGHTVYPVTDGQTIIKYLKRRSARVLERIWPIGPLPITERRVQDFRKAAEAVAFKQRAQ